MLNFLRTAEKLKGRNLFQGRNATPRTREKERKGGPSMTEERSAYGVYIQLTMNEKNARRLRLVKRSRRKRRYEKDGEDTRKKTERKGDGAQ